IEAEELGRPDLVAAGGGQRGRDERLLDLADHTIIKPRRRQLAAVAGEVAAKMAFGELGKRRRLSRPRLLHAGGQRLAELAIDDLGRDRVLRVESDKTTDEVLELADIARPGVLL